MKNERKKVLPSLLVLGRWGRIEGGRGALGAWRVVRGGQRGSGGHARPPESGGVCVGPANVKKRKKAKKKKEKEKRKNLHRY
jgi:hypothetical protein